MGSREVSSRSFSLFPQALIDDLTLGSWVSPGKPHDNARFARRPRRGPPSDPDQGALRLVLFLGLSGPDLSTDLAAGAVPHLRRQFGICNHCRDRVHARAGTWQSGWWLGVEAARDRSAAFTGGDRNNDSQLRYRFVKRL